MACKQILCGEGNGYILFVMNFSCYIKISNYRYSVL